MESWEKRYNSLKDEFIKLQKELDIIKQTNTLLELEKRQWQQDKIQQTMIIQQQLMNSDKKVKELEKEIIELKSAEG